MCMYIEYYYFLHIMLLLYTVYVYVYGLLLFLAHNVTIVYSLCVCIWTIIISCT